MDFYGVCFFVQIDVDWWYVVEYRKFIVAEYLDLVLYNPLFCTTDI